MDYLFYGNIAFFCLTTLNETTFYRKHKGLLNWSGNGNGLSL